MLSCSDGLFLLRAETAPNGRAISSDRSEGRLVREKHPIKRNYARLYKIEQRTFLGIPNLPNSTARKSDIGREAGLGRVVSLISPYSSLRASKTPPPEKWNGSNKLAGYIFRNCAKWGCTASISVPGCLHVA